jgi:hypothetical protein
MSGVGQHHRDLSYPDEFADRTASPTLGEVAAVSARHHRSMVSRYDRPSGMSKGQAVGWVFAVSSLFWPRLFILLFWVFFDEMFKDAYSTWIVPFLGFFLLPWTTLAYASMWGLSSDRVSGLEWVVVGIALILDVWTYAGIRRLWSGS